MERIYPNCLNCNNLITDEKNEKHCKLDFYKEVMPEYELKATWCTKYENILTI
ncbi:MAG TPA: hypothetical protein VIK86_02070 [Candidatus Paceibacterota bacterium]